MRGPHPGAGWGPLMFVSQSVGASVPGSFGFAAADRRGALFGVVPVPVVPGVVGAAVREALLRRGVVGFDHPRDHGYGYHPEEAAPVRRREAGGAGHGRPDRLRHEHERGPIPRRDGALSSSAGRRSSPGRYARPTVPRTSPSCLLYTSPSPRDGLLSRMPSSA